jgi:toxin YoeB
LTWKVEFSRQAKKDAALIAGSKLSKKLKMLFVILQRNPFQNPPPYEKLGGEMKGHYSRRINKQHRLVYEVDKAKNVVFVVRMWTHYE